MKIKRLIVLAFVLGIIASCTKDAIKPTVIYPTKVVTIVKFSTDILPTLQSNCAVCHDGSSTPDYTSNTYLNIMTYTPKLIDTITPTNSLLYKDLIGTGNHDMSSHSNSTFNNKVLSWIQQGAKNN